MPINRKRMRMTEAFETIPPEDDYFETPNILEICGDKDHRITIGFVTDGATEKDLINLNWGFSYGWDDATTRYFRTHSIRDVLAGDNKMVIPKSVVVTFYGSIIVDLEVKGKLKIKDYLSIGSDTMARLIFDIIVWNQEKPVKRHLIDSSWEGITIVEFQDNGHSVITWPIKNKTFVHP